MKKIYLVVTYAYLLISTSCYAQFNTLLNFDGTTNGTSPAESLLSDGTFLYGMTSYGGTNNLGTIFKILPDGTGYVNLMDFAGATNGSLPQGSLITDGTFLYGMTQQGGINDLGTIFKILPDGTGYVKLLDFAGATNGGFPNGTLYSDGTFLYGMTAAGGMNDIGVIFKIKPDGTNFDVLLNMGGGTTGRYPEGPLISDGTFLYGLTPAGGTSNLGTIFKIMPDGTGYVKLLNFAGGSDGSTPRGSLLSDGTNLYGMTSYGGANNFGTIFKIMPNGSGYVKLFDFTGGLDGIIPTGPLITDGTFLYGTTEWGGANDLGTIFKILPDGNSYEKLLDFDGAIMGSKPRGYLISDGSFLYGMTSFGGTNDVGVLFKFHPTGLGFEGNTLNAITIYPNPTSGIINISPSISGMQSVSISNIMGKEIKNEEMNIVAGSPFIIDINDQPAGIYLLRIGNFTKRIIRE